MIGGDPTPELDRGAKDSPGRRAGLRLGRIVQNRFITSFVAISLFVVIWLGLTRGWNLDLYEPLSYSGDALEMASYLGRDYVFNDLHERLFAPFGVTHASPVRYLGNFLFQPNSTLFLIAYLATRDVIGAVNLYYL